MLEYVNKQSKEFKSLYIEILVTDSAEGHGQQFSCIKGIVERLLTTTGKVVEVLRDTEKNKKEQYTQLHMIISPPFTLGTLLKEWMEIHKEGQNIKERKKTNWSEVGFQGEERARLFLEIQV